MGRFAIGFNPTFGVSILTLLIVWTVFHALFIGSSMVERFAPLIDAAMEVKLEATTAHLRLEEILGGDSETDIEDVWKHIDNAEWYARAMLEGGENEEGRFIALENPELRQKVEIALDEIHAYKEIALLKWENSLRADTESGADQLFDKKFDSFILYADEVETNLQEMIKEKMWYFRLLQIFLTIIVILLGAIIGIILFRNDKRRLNDIQELQSREEKLDTTLNSIGDAVLVSDMEGTIIRMNPVAEKITGWKFEEAVGRSLSEVLVTVNSVTRETANNPVGKVLESGERGEFANHTVLIAKDGKEYQIADSSAPIKDSEGNASGIITVFRNTSEEYKLQERCANDRNRLIHILEGTNAGTWDWNVETGEIILNDRWAEIMGVTLDELGPITIQTWRNSVHPDDLPKANSLLEQNFSGELDYYDTVFRQPHKNGDWVWVNARGKVVEWTDDGKPLRMSGTHLDITERKKAEEEVTLIRHELENTNKELESFSHTIAHDLKAPLRQIHGFINILEMSYAEKLDNNGKHYLEVIYATSAKMEDLINNILRFSRTSQKELNYETVDLSKVARQIAVNLSQNDPDRTIKIEIADNLETEGDAALLNVVMENLLGNSWKFTNKTAKPQIEFGITKINEKQTFFVKDNGAGFDQKHIDKIFTPFQRLHAYEEFKGSGIGLATVQRIIQRHNGKIWAEGETDNGATFYFTIGKE